MWGLDFVSSICLFAAGDVRLPFGVNPRARLVSLVLRSWLSVIGMRTNSSKSCTAFPGMCDSVVDVAVMGDMVKESELVFPGGVV